jgi:hypothetical protein
LATSMDLLPTTPFGANFGGADNSFGPHGPKQVQCFSERRALALVHHPQHEFIVPPDVALHLRRIVGPQQDRSVHEGLH